MIRIAFDFFKKQTSLTLCIILRDGSEFLQGFDELKPDEIVILDCRKENPPLQNNARVLPCSVLNDMETLMQKAKENSQFEWILLLNSDEFIESKHSASIRKLISDKNENAFSFETHNYINKKEGTVYSNFIPNKGLSFEKGDGYFIINSMRLFRKSSEHDFKIKKSDIIIHNYNSLNSLNSNNSLELDIAEEKLKKNKISRNYFNVGILYLNKKNYKKAAELFHEANKLDPMNIEIHHSLGVAYFKMGNYVKALKSMTTGLRVHPKDAKSFTNPNAFAVLFASIGAILTKQERYTKAIISYEKAIKMNHPQSELLKEKIEELKKIKENQTKLNYQLTLNE